MRELVEDLLTLARADEEAVAADRNAEGVVQTDLSALVSGCCLEFDPVAFERGCSISADLAPDVSARVRPDDYRRVVRVLLDNATKYAPRGSAVLVALRRDGRRTRLTVSNLGEVIAPEDLEHLFDRFYRTDQARQRRGTGGFGLGLAIAKSLVEAGGGTISATSDARRGTTLCVTL